MRKILLTTIISSFILLIILIPKKEPEKPEHKHSKTITVIDTEPQPVTESLNNVPVREDNENETTLNNFLNQVNLGAWIDIGNKQFRITQNPEFSKSSLSITNFEFADNITSIVLETYNENYSFNLISLEEGIYLEKNGKKFEIYSAPLTPQFTQIYFLSKNDTFWGYIIPDGSRLWLRNSINSNWCLLDLNLSTSKDTWKLTPSCEENEELFSISTLQVTNPIIKSDTIKVTAQTSISEIGRIKQPLTRTSNILGTVFQVSLDHPLLHKTESLIYIETICLPDFNVYIYYDSHFKSYVHALFNPLTELKANTSNSYSRIITHVLDINLSPVPIITVSTFF